MILPDGTRQSVELRNVFVTSHRMPKGFRQPFSLEFLPEPGPAQPQRIYRMEHESLGPMEVFLCPLQGGDGRSEEHTSELQSR